MQNKDYPKLRECPFCGNDVCAEIDNVNKAFKVYCLNCPAEMWVPFQNAGLDDGSLISFDEAMQWMSALIERWNERS